MKDWNEEYREEWEKLGFHYDRNDQNKAWLLVGSVKGLMNFAAILKEYVVDPAYTDTSEHLHLGPHEHLKIVTWYRAEINSDGIYGTIEDLSRLASLLEEKINALAQNDILFQISSEYADNTDWKIRFVIIDEKHFKPWMLDSSII